jgi:hypothetical protein
MCEVTYPHLHIRPIEEVLDYESCDAPWLGGRVGRDCLKYKYEDTVQIEALLTIIERDGYKQGYGVAVKEAGERFCSCCPPPTGPYIHDGHHRLTVMYYMGAYWCPVQKKASHGDDTPDYRDSKAAARQRKYGGEKVLW